VFLDDDKKYRDITYIFKQTPFTYTMGQAVGKDYQIAKDFLKYNGYKPKKWLSLIISMSNTWLNNIPKKD